MSKKGEKKLVDDKLTEKDVKDATAEVGAIEDKEEEEKPEKVYVPKVLFTKKWGKHFPGDTKQVHIELIKEAKQSVDQYHSGQLGVFTSKDQKGGFVSKVLAL